MGAPRADREGAAVPVDPSWDPQGSIQSAELSPDGKAMAAVNARCLEGVEPSSLKIMPFDGRSR